MRSPSDPHIHGEGHAAAPDGGCATRHDPNVLLGTESAHPIIRLPLTALYQQGQQPAVWIIDPGTSAVVLTPVQVARYTQEAVEISAGLKAGDVVVRAGVHKLTAGQKVRVLAEPDAS